MGLRKLLLRLMNSGLELITVPLSLNYYETFRLSTAQPGPEVAVRALMGVICLPVRARGTFTDSYFLSVILYRQVRSIHNRLITVYDGKQIIGENKPRTIKFAARLASFCRRAAEVLPGYITVTPELRAAIN